MNDTTDTTDPLWPETAGHLRAAVDWLEAQHDTMTSDDLTPGVSATDMAVRLMKASRALNMRPLTMIARVITAEGLDGTCAASALYDACEARLRCRGDRDAADQDALKAARQSLQYFVANSVAYPG